MKRNKPVDIAIFRAPFSFSLIALSSFSCSPLISVIIAVRLESGLFGFNATKSRRNETWLTVLTEPVVDATKFPMAFIISV